MPGLHSALSAAQSSLQAFSRGLSVTQTNLANAATRGYARQRVALAPTVTPQGGLALGVEIAGVTSLRDNLLEYQALAAKQRFTGFETTDAIYRSIESAFQLDGEGSIGVATDNFFGAVAALSVHPGDPNLRAEVGRQADNFASTVRDTAAEISGRRNNLDSEIRAVVSRINQLGREIADLQKNRAAPDAAEPNHSIETRTQQALDELAGLVSFQTQVQSDGTLSIVTGGTFLVAGSEVRPFNVSLSQDSIRIVDEDGKDLTTQLEGAGGKLGALLEARNQTLPGLLGEVDRLAKSVADRVNEQLARGVDLNGSPGQPLFEYTTSYVEGSGRTAGTAGAATPVPPPSVAVTFSNGLTGTITASLDSFFVAASPPTAPAAGDRVSVRLVSADGSIDRTIETAPLLGGETTAELAARLNDQVALTPELDGLVEFSDEAGALKLVLSDEAGQGFSFSSATDNPGFTTGLEPGGALGGHSAEELAAALNAEVAADPALAEAGVRFAAVGGEVRLDADVRFDYAVADSDPAGTGFASGLDGLSGTAGGAPVSSTLAVSGISDAEIAAGKPGSPLGNENALELAALAEQPLFDGLTFNERYARLVTDLGGAAENNRSQLETQEAVLRTAQNLRDNVSAVDVNEETLKLLEFEQGYSAMLRVIQVVNGLNDEILTLVR